MVTSRLQPAAVASTGHITLAKAHRGNIAIISKRMNYVSITTGMEHRPQGTGPTASEDLEQVYLAAAATLIAL